MFWLETDDVPTLKNGKTVLCAGQTVLYTGHAGHPIVFSPEKS